VFNCEKSCNLPNGTNQASEFALIENNEVGSNETFPVKFSRKCRTTKCCQTLDWVDSITSKMALESGKVDVSR
jgi:hypothetical protein